MRQLTHYITTTTQHKIEYFAEFAENTKHDLIATVKECAQNGINAEIWLALENCTALDDATMNNDNLNRAQWIEHITDTKNIDFRKYTLLDFGIVDEDTYKAIALEEYAQNKTLIILVGARTAKQENRLLNAI